MQSTTFRDWVSVGIAGHLAFSNSITRFVSRLAAELHHNTAPDVQNLDSNKYTPSLNLIRCSITDTQVMCHSHVRNVARQPANATTFLLGPLTQTRVESTAFDS